MLEDNSSVDAGRKKEKSLLNTEIFEKMLAKTFKDIYTA